MPSFVIGWQYLTGSVVATDPASRTRAEWPPHPARVFMALAAAWFETAPVNDAVDSELRDYDAEGDALRWLESLGEPELWLPRIGIESERSLVTVYVPVNDKAGPSSATLQSVPALTRSKQARTFPRRFVGEASCALYWPDANGLEAHCDALARVCAKVTRIGHSSSVVRMWVANPQEIESTNDLERWEPEDIMATTHCRPITAGLLDSLPVQTQIPRVEEFTDLVWRIQDAQRVVDSAKSGGDVGAKKTANRELKQAKEAYQAMFGEKYRKSSSSPPRLRPKVGLWTGYRRAEVPESKPIAECSNFDTDLLILTHIGGPRLPLTSALTAGKALRDLIMKNSGVQPVPRWVSGHKTDGSPSDDAKGHLAIVPLAFVGGKHADGHLLGMALAFPRNIERQERGRVLGPLLVDGQGKPEKFDLTLGPLGMWTLCKSDWSEGRGALQPETWTAHPNGATTWTSVTPVVLDKFPKSVRSNPQQRAAWEREVRAIIADACTRTGLPHPIHIDIDTTSWHAGSPRAVTKRRRLRRASLPADCNQASLGVGFPAYPPKGTNASRPQVHVFLQFAVPVIGPVLLGAGRYRGYGLFKPWGEWQ